MALSQEVVKGLFKMSKTSEIDNWLADRVMQPLTWGLHDCCLFAADFVSKLYGRDYGEWARGIYKTALGARRALRKFCGGDVTTLFEMFENRANWKEILPVLAKSGNVCTIETPYGIAAAVVWRGRILAQGPQGVVSLPLNKIIRSWEVPKE